MIMILAAGCSSKSGSTGGSAALTAAVPKPEQPDITVAAIPAVDLAGLYIAQDRGLFARPGLHVTIVPVPSAQSVITGQLAGTIDISAGSYVAYIAAQAAGARFRILAEASTFTVQATMARDDQLPAEVTASMALPRYPVGPVVEAEIQRVARAMGQTGILGREDATEAEQRALVSSMTSPGS
jgi:ABC-type nitrate/sulfonate/bicarbonate transport system substrate-binding protein